MDGELPKDASLVFRVVVNSLPVGCFRALAEAPILLTYRGIGWHVGDSARRITIDPRDPYRRQICGCGTGAGAEPRWRPVVCDVAMWGDHSHEAMTVGASRALSTGFRAW